MNKSVFPLPLPLPWWKGQGEGGQNERHRFIHSKTMTERIKKIGIYSILVVLRVVIFTIPSSAEENTVVLLSRLWSPQNERTFVIDEILKPFQQENNCTVILNIEKDQVIFEQVETEVEAKQVV